MQSSVPGVPAPAKVIPPRTLLRFAEESRPGKTVLQPHPCTLQLPWRAASIAAIPVAIRVQPVTMKPRIWVRSLDTPARGARPLNCMQPAWEPIPPPVPSPPDMGEPAFPVLEHRIRVSSFEEPVVTYKPVCPTQPTIPGPMLWVLSRHSIPSRTGRLLAGPVMRRMEIRPCEVTALPESKELRSATPMLPKLTIEDALAVRPEPASPHESPRMAVVPALAFKNFDRAGWRLSGATDLRISVESICQPLATPPPGAEWSIRDEVIPVVTYSLATRCTTRALQLAAWPIAAGAMKPTGFNPEPLPERLELAFPAADSTPSL
jgi:hypothetical protein